MTRTIADRRRGGGRPTREQAEARHAELLDRALDHFLEKGFELTTIEAIASDVGMTKRTIYARHPDKAALFRAAVRRGIARHAIADNRIRATETDDIARTLANVARLRLDMVSSPEGLKLQRIVQTESYRFPDLFSDCYDIGALPLIDYVADLLERETRAGRLAVDDPVVAASTFLSMVISGPVHFVLAGRPLPRKEIDKRLTIGIRLFLDGARPR